jgi:uncharacterized pyridoxal phosphate-containing UPF0001 family protein
LKPVSDIQEAFNAGQIHFGENYVQGKWMDMYEIDPEFAVW